MKDIGDVYHVLEEVLGELKGLAREVEAIKEELQEIRKEK